MGQTKETHELYIVELPPQGKYEWAFAVKSLTNDENRAWSYIKLNSYNPVTPVTENTEKWLMEHWKMCSFTEETEGKMAEEVLKAMRRSAAHEDDKYTRSSAIKTWKHLLKNKTIDKAQYLEGAELMKKLFEGAHIPMSIGLSMCLLDCLGDVVVGFGQALLCALLVIAG